MRSARTVALGGLWKNVVDPFMPAKSRASSRNAQWATS
jgi:hypothetical protein